VHRLDRGGSDLHDLVHADSAGMRDAELQLDRQRDGCGRHGLGHDGEEHVVAEVQLRRGGKNMKTTTNPHAGGHRAGRRLVGIVVVAAAFAGAGGPAKAQPAVSTPFSYGITTSYTYRTDGIYSGLLSTTKTMPDVLASCTLKTVDYDTHGNLVSTRLENCAGAPAAAAFTTRTTTATYGAEPAQVITVGGAQVPVSAPAGLLPTATTNAASQSTTIQFDPRFGAPLKTVDIDNLTSTQAVDDFGRVTSQRLPDGTSVATRYCILASTGLDTTSNSSGCPTPATSEAPANAFMFTEKRPLDAAGNVMGAWTRTYTDRLGRDIRVVTQGYDGPSQGTLSGGLVVADKVYGVVGQVLLESDPHFLSNGSTSTTGSNDVRVTSYDYDALGRAVAVAVSDPAGQGGGIDFSRNGPTGYGVLTAAVSRVAYAGLATTLTNDKGQTRIEERDPFKQLVRVTDANGGQLSTLYDAFGHVVKTQDALGNVTAYTFDAKGDLLQQNDPDKGVTNLTYDALGQVITSQNANEAAWDTSTTLTYDVMGRVTARTATDYNSSWTYDTCANGVGRLCSASSTNQVNKTYTYDCKHPANTR
jgi:YD repeat-containing protein